MDCRHLICVISLFYLKFYIYDLGCSSLCSRIAFVSLILFNLFVLRVQAIFTDGWNIRTWFGFDEAFRIRPSQQYFAATLFLFGSIASRISN